MIEVGFSLNICSVIWASCDMSTLFYWMPRWTFHLWISVELNLLSWNHLGLHFEDKFIHVRNARCLYQTVEKAAGTFASSSFQLWLILWKQAGPFCRSVPSGALQTGFLSCNLPLLGYWAVRAQDVRGWYWEKEAPVNAFGDEGFPLPFRIWFGRSREFLLLSSTILHMSTLLFMKQHSQIGAFIPFSVFSLGVRFNSVINVNRYCCNSIEISNCVKNYHRKLQWCKVFFAVNHRWRGRKVIEILFQEYQWMGVALRSWRKLVVKKLKYSLRNIQKALFDSVLDLKSRYLQQKGGDGWE